jgi:hypothetical protein
MTPFPPSLSITPYGLEPSIQWPGAWDQCPSICATIRRAIDFVPPCPVIREGLEELARLQLSPNDHDMLANMGAPHVIADAMQFHVSSMLLVQLWRCAAMWNVSSTRQNQRAFVDADALDVILVAMDRFTDNVDVQEKAIATLSNLGAAQDNLPIYLLRKEPSCE